MKEHRVFGTKEDAVYLDRKGAYVILICDNMVGVVKTPKGYFFLGGGIEDGESDAECINRECLEEAGCTVSIGNQVCTAETYGIHERMGYFHPIQTYYKGEFISQVSEPTEEDHKFVWMEYDKLKGNMYLEMQNWALDKCFI